MFKSELATIFSSALIYLACFLVITLLVKLEIWIVITIATSFSISLVIQIISYKRNKTKES